MREEGKTDKKTLSRSQERGWHRRVVALPHLSPPVRDLRQGCHLVVIVDLEAQFAQGRPEGGSPEGAPKVEPPVVPRRGLKLSQQERQFPRLVFQGVDVRVGRQVLGVVGAPEHYGHHAVHQRLPQLLRHVGIAHGVLEGQVKQVPSGQDVLPTAILAVGLSPTAAAGGERGAYSEGFSFSPKRKGKEEDVLLCLLETISNNEKEEIQVSIYT